jgi:hypothetical protein
VKAVDVMAVVHLRFVGCCLHTAVFPGLNKVLDTLCTVFFVPIFVI